MGDAANYKEIDNAMSCIGEDNLVTLLLLVTLVLLLKDNLVTLVLL